MKDGREEFRLLGLYECDDGEIILFTTESIFWSDYGEPSNCIIIDRIENNYVFINMNRNTVSSLCIQLPQILLIEDSTMYSRSKLVEEIEYIHNHIKNDKYTMFNGILTVKTHNCDGQYYGISEVVIDKSKMISPEHFNDADSLTPEHAKLIQLHSSHNTGMLPVYAQLFLV